MRPLKSKRASLDGVDSTRRKPPSRDQASRPLGVRIVEAPGASTGSANTANSPNGRPISDIDSGFQKKLAAATSRPPITPTEPSTGIALNSSSPLWRAHSLTSESNDLRATCICLPTSTASRSASNRWPGRTPSWSADEAVTSSTGRPSPFAPRSDQPEGVRSIVAMPRSPICSSVAAYISSLMRSVSR